MRNELSLSLRMRLTAQIAGRRKIRSVLLFAFPFGTFFRFLAATIEQCIRSIRSYPVAFLARARTVERSRVKWRREKQFLRSRRVVREPRRSRNRQRGRILRRRRYNGLLRHCYATLFYKGRLFPVGGSDRLPK